jgi:Mg-chelatase subunit ChlD
MECMQLREVPPRKGNADAIAQMYPNMELGGSTPTDRAMNKVVDDLIAAQAGVDLTKQPQFIILATDGQPNDICVGGVGGDGVAQQMGVIAAVDRAWQSHITTFVISLAGGDMGLEAHLAEVARHGNMADPAAHPFTPANPDELVATLVQLLGTALNCNVE